MSEPRFFQTRMGRTYYEHTMPELVKQLERLNNLLERSVDNVSRYGRSPSDRQGEGSDER